MDKLLGVPRKFVLIALLVLNVGIIGYNYETVYAGEGRNTSKETILEIEENSLEIQLAQEVIEEKLTEKVEVINNW